MATLLTWPEALRDTPAIAVIEQAIARQRLSHSLLLTGEDIDTLEAVALGIADRLLNTPASTANFAPTVHPDCFTLRPTGKMRQISADATRELIGKVQVSPSVSAHKVVIIYETDRMNTAAANIFLKTLEEPPGHTSLLLLTTRPYALLPTIRSRCLTFRFPVVTTEFAPDGWKAWLSDYATWLGKLRVGVTTKPEVADAIIAVFGLVARFDLILDLATTDARKASKGELPEDLSDDEEIALETGIANGIRSRMFAEIARATRHYAQAGLMDNTEGQRLALAEAIEQLESDVGLLRVNLNVRAALEAFLLASLRIWSPGR